jgi:hypothetical protein
MGIHNRRVGDAGAARRNSNTAKPYYRNKNLLKVKIIYQCLSY